MTKHEHLVRFEMMVQAHDAVEACEHVAELLRNHADTMTYEVRTTTGQVEPEVVDLEEVAEREDWFGVREMQAHLDRVLSIRG